MYMYVNISNTVNWFAVERAMKHDTVYDLFLDFFR